MTQKPLHCPSRVAAHKLHPGALCSLEGSLTGPEVLELGWLEPLSPVVVVVVVVECFHDLGKGIVNQLSDRRSLWAC